MISSLRGLFKTLDPGVIANLVVVVAGVLGTRSELEAAIVVTNEPPKFPRSRDQNHDSSLFCFSLSI